MERKEPFLSFFRLRISKMFTFEQIHLVLPVHLLRASSMSSSLLMGFQSANLALINVGVGFLMLILAFFGACYRQICADPKGRRRHEGMYCTGPTPLLGPHTSKTNTITVARSLLLTTEPKDSSWIHHNTGEMISRECREPLRCAR
jgi:hypothetical protein